jgi:PAS domain S-box-containing protein
VRASEERLRTIFEGSSDAILVADAKTRRFTDCNKQAERLLGYPKSKILAMGVNDIHPKDELEKVGATFARMARGSNETLDTLIVRRDGKRVPVGITSAAVTLKGRKALIGSFRDLTERKQAEEALAASEAKYRSLVENASVGVFESDLAGNILYFNRMLKALSGYSDAELERMNAAMLYDDPQQRKAILSELESRGRFDPTEVLMHDKRGEDVWLLMSAVMVGNAIQGTAVNITDRKKAEQELKEAFEKLKTLDELKTDFVQMVSHELRTPLSSMRLASDLMAKELSPEEDREAHGIMRRNTDRMERIVSTVLNFSAIESGRVKYAHAPVDASALAREAADNARAEAAAKGVSLEFKEGSVPPVLGDAFWLGIAVGNLVENAVKFTERGGVTVETMRRGKRVLVRVRDTGLGLDKGNLETAFQKFTKAHPNIEGSGIGLWMSKRIAEAHRGDVTLKSAGRGKGTTAELWLPAKGI